MPETDELLSALLGEPNQDAGPETEPTETETPQSHENDSSESEPEPTEKQAEDEPEQDDAPLTFKGLAEKLDMKPADLYAIELGEGLTIGQLKDRMGDLTASDEVLQQAELHKQQGENELMQRRRELSVVAQNLGREPTQAEMQQAQQQHEQYVDHETTLTMQSIPEWTDTSVAETERRAIAELLTEYGLSPQEIAGVVDHRQIKLLNDAARLRTKVKQAGQPKRGGTKQKPKSSGKRSGTNINRVTKAHKEGKVNKNDALLAVLTDGLKQ